MKNKKKDVDCSHSFAIGLLSGLLFMYVIMYFVMIIVLRAVGVLS